MVYAFNTPDSAESTLNFWNVKSNDKYTKSVEKLMSITSAGDHCVVTTKINDGFAQYVLTLYNAIGVAVDFKYLDFEPKYVAVSKTNVYACSGSIVFHWQFKILATVKMTALDGILGN